MLALPAQVWARPHEAGGDGQLAPEQRGGHPEDQDHPEDHPEKADRAVHERGAVWRSCTQSSTQLVAELYEAAGLLGSATHTHGGGGGGGGRGGAVPRDFSEGGAVEGRLLGGHARLQPYAIEAATLCHRGCNHVPSRLQLVAV